MQNLHVLSISRYLMVPRHICTLLVRMCAYACIYIYTYDLFWYLYTQIGTPWYTYISQICSTAYMLYWRMSNGSSFHCVNPLGFFALFPPLSCFFLSQKGVVAHMGIPVCIAVQCTHVITCWNDGLKLCQITESNGKVRVSMSSCYCWWPESCTILFSQVNSP